MFGAASLQQLEQAAQFQEQLAQVMAVSQPQTDLPGLWVWAEQLHLPVLITAQANGGRDVYAAAHQFETGLPSQAAQQGFGLQPQIVTQGGGRQRLPFADGGCSLAGGFGQRHVLAPEGWDTLMVEGQAGWGV